MELPHILYELEDALATGKYPEDVRDEVVGNVLRVLGKPRLIDICRKNFPCLVRWYIRMGADVHFRDDWPLMMA